MTDRKPDFYRIVRINDGVREYTNGNCAWTSKKYLAAAYESEEEARTARDNFYDGGRIVPVYVKVTRRPKLHDFAWALRRMREGKRVRRAGQSTHYLCAKSYGGDLLPNCIRYNGPGGCGDVDDITTQDLTACDWQLYEAP